MVISADRGLLIHHCLRCWDIHDELVEEVVWFNTDTMVASAVIEGIEQRVEIGKFSFRVQLPTAALRLKEALPDHLHEHIEQIESA